jgi:hypothetical protein
MLVLQYRWELTTFAMQLNEMTEGLREKLPPTDSRLRPDLQLLERANYDKVSAVWRLGRDLADAVERH